MLPYNFSNTISYSHKFKRPFYEKDSAIIKMIDDKLHLFVNALGVAEGDLDVQVQPTDNPNNQELTISGETEHVGLDETFQFSVRMLARKPLDEVNKIGFNSGILELQLVFKEPVAPDVKINFQSIQFQN